MEDLISRSETIDRIAEFLSPKGLDEWEVMVEVRQIIQSMPAIKDTQAIRGKWVKTRMNGGYEKFQCSICKNYDNGDAVPGRYCWQCGAKMDFA